MTLSMCAPQCCGEFCSERPVIAVVGLRRRDFDRLVQVRAAESAGLIYGGCIEESSNASRIAECAIAQASVVVLNTAFSRKLPALCCNGKEVLQCRAFSSAKARLEEWAARRSL